MNLLLIHPYITVRDLNVDLNEPLGLICLATYMKQIFGRDINVSILDLYEMGADKPKAIENDKYIVGINDISIIKREIDQFSPDLIGITCNFTAYAQDVLEVASIVKSISPEIPLVMGGAHVTMASISMMEENSNIDFIIRNEGEITLEQLIIELTGDQQYESINGLTYRNKDGCIFENPERKLIKDIDILPIPDRKYIKMNRYMSFPRVTTWYTRKRPIASIITSRGCPYDCIFCSTKVMWRRHWRPRSVKKVIEEIEILISKYDVKEVTIFDDQFFANRMRVNDICDYFIKRKGKMYFSYDAGTSPWLVDKPLLEKMKKAGFYAIRFPIETGNRRTLTFIKKPVDLDNAKEIIKVANKLGYWTSANFILGFPYETKTEMEETIKYAYESGLDFTSFIAARPHKGSELYEIYEKEGLLEKGIVHTSLFDQSDYDTTQMTAKEITQIITKASKGWYLNKIKFFLKPYNFVNYFLPKMQSFDDCLYSCKMIAKLIRIKMLPLLKK